MIDLDSVRAAAEGVLGTSVRVDTALQAVLWLAAFVAGTKACKHVGISVRDWLTVAAAILKAGWWTTKFAGRATGATGRVAAGIAALPFRKPPMGPLAQAILDALDDASLIQIDGDSLETPTISVKPLDRFGAIELSVEGQDIDTHRLREHERKAICRRALEIIEPMKAAAAATEAANLARLVRGETTGRAIRRAAETIATARINRKPTESYSDELV